MKSWCGASLLDNGDVVSPTGSGSLGSSDQNPWRMSIGAFFSFAMALWSRRTRSTIGRSELHEWAAGKPAWKSWQRVQHFYAIIFSSLQVREIAEALGGRAPQNPTKLVLALSETLTEVTKRPRFLRRRAIRADRASAQTCAVAVPGIATERHKAGAAAPAAEWKPEP